MAFSPAPKAGGPPTVSTLTGGPRGDADSTKGSSVLPRPCSPQPESTAGLSGLGSRPAGFTLIEMLVAFSIVGMLVGLLLPAVQAARESARRSQCASNLHEIGVAVHAFHSRYGFLPSSPRLSTSPASTPTGPNPIAAALSWEAYLLPDLDEMTVYNRLDPTQSWSSATASPDFQVPNSVVVALQVPTFACPAGTDPKRLDGDPTQHPWTPLAASTDYGTITQVEQRTADAGLVDAAGLGLMPIGVRATFDQVPDGLSNTLLLVESAGRPQVYRQRKPFGICRPTGSTGAAGAGRPAISAWTDRATTARPFPALVLSTAPMAKISAVRPTPIRPHTA